ncbi:permease [Gemmatirosa kalamazoonensis]|uniref:Permease n=1 Tax=Gemmatirosa kalamazoonensis TaxID=861299 RepID=W0RC79_9BACT|nr:ABC transporter permease [Gemmatirosa kalamazoonensis]AHG87930.1 permease [Gemmatirosa kalamazoonensis]
MPTPKPPLWRRYLRFWGANPAQDLDDEFRFHLDTEIEELVAAGMSPERARAAALAKFGDVEAARADCRASDERREARAQRAASLDVLRQDVKHTWRSFRRRPRFLAAAVLTLAIGIGANTAIFSVVNGVLLSDPGYRDPDRLVLLWQTARDVPQIAVSYQDFLDWQQRTRSFEGGGAGLAAVNGYESFTLTGVAEPERLSGALTTGNMFRVLGVSAAHGRTLTPADEAAGAEPVAVLTDKFWRRRFAGDERVVGRTILLDGRSYTIVGVMPPSFRFGGVDVWVPIGQFAHEERFASRSNHPGLTGIGRLRPGVTLDAMNADLARVSAQIHKEHPETDGIGAAGTSLEEITVGGVRPALRMLWAAVGLVLLIACANVANLMLGRVAERRHDFALRAAIGAGRRRLVRQALTESVVLALLGGALGVALAWAGVKLLLALEPANLPRLSAIRVDGVVLAFALGVSLVTGLLFGVVPARMLARSDPIGTLREAGRGAVGTGRRRGLAAGLTVTEVALALVLLVGAGLLLRSFAKLTGVAPGFDPRHVVAGLVELPKARYPDDASRRRAFDELLRRAAAVPGVEVAALGSDLPVNSGWQTTVTFEGVTFREGNPPLLDATLASTGFFRALRVKLLEGRTFEPADDASHPRVAVVSARVARRVFGASSAVGRRIKQGPRESDAPWITIVGVVDDVRNDGLATEPRGTLYFPFDQSPGSSSWVIVRTTLPAGRVVPALRRELAAIDRDLPLSEVQTLEDALSRTVSQPRFSMLMLTIFAGAALLLAAVGLYGVIATGVAQRQREISVRIALGARPRSVVRWVVGQSLRLTVVGIAIGAAAAYASGRVLASLLYEVRPTDPPVFVAVAVLLAAVAVVAALVPAMRAARTDPAAVIRET